MLIMTLLVFSACGSDSSLVGRWELVSLALVVDGDESYREEVSGVFYEFFSGGNGVASALGEGNERFTWSTSRGRLTLASDRGHGVLSYSISGSTLVLIEESYMFDYESYEIISVMTFRRAN